MVTKHVKITFFKYQPLLLSLTKLSAMRGYYLSTTQLPFLLIYFCKGLSGKTANHQTNQKALNISFAELDILNRNFELLMENALVVSPNSLNNGLVRLFIICENIMVFSRLGLDQRFWSKDAALKMHVSKDLEIKE